MAVSVYSKTITPNTTSQTSHAHKNCHVTLHVRPKPTRFRQLYGVKEYIAKSHENYFNPFLIFLERNIFQTRPMNTVSFIEKDGAQMIFVFTRLH